MVIWSFKLYKIFFLLNFRGKLSSYYYSLIIQPVLLRKSHQRRSITMHNIKEHRGTLNIAWKIIYFKTWFMYSNFEISQQRNPNWVRQNNLPKIQISKRYYTCKFWLFPLFNHINYINQTRFLYVHVYNTLICISKLYIFLYFILLLWLFCVLLIIQCCFWI